MRAAAILLLLAATSLTPKEAAAAGAPEALLAADAAVFAPPDFKRQIVKHRSDLMRGVRDAASAAPGTSAEHRAAALALARDIARSVRGHARFAEVSYRLGSLVHECAAIGGLPSAAPARSSFAGFPPAPFRDPDVLLGVPAGTDRWSAALTRTTRLIAWIWKEAGGDASIALRMPEAKGPYAVRE